MGQYIGARYVPRFMGTYDATQDYEALDVVDNGLGTSYISKIPTPPGTPLTDTDHWAIYGASSGAIVNLQNQIDDLRSDVDELYINVKNYGAEGDGTTDDTVAIQTALNTGANVYFPDGVYIISNTLNYSGKKLFGTGTIKTSVALEKAVVINNSDLIEVSGISIDGNALSATLLHISSCKQVLVHHCTMYNTENATLLNVRGCSGIYITECDNTEVYDCVIENINRTQTSPGTISSAGIVSASDISYIHNNYINNVKCSSETTDCDGIYVVGKLPGLSGVYTGHAIIENNTIYNCTGRFIKSQCAQVSVKSNELRIINDFILNAMFIAIDPQMGNALIENNIIDFKHTYNRTYAFVSRSDLNSYNMNVNITVQNNKIYGTVDSSLDVRAILRIDCNNNGGTIDALIVNNDEQVGFETVATIMGTNMPTGVIKVTNNILRSKQIANNTSLNTLVGILFDVEDNDNSASSTKLAISSYLTQFDSVIFKNNLNADPITTNSLDFDTLKICDFVHYDATKISNKPYGGTGAIHMQKNETMYSFTYLQATVPQPTYFGYISP